MTQDDLCLSQKPTLSDLQQYVAKAKKIRGFKEDKKNTLIFLFAEVGELVQAIKKNGGLAKISAETQKEISFEMADILIFLLDLANQYEICLETALRAKEEINKKRTWSKKQQLETT